MNETEVRRITTTVFALLFDALKPFQGQMIDRGVHEHLRNAAAAALHSSTAWGPGDASNIKIVCDETNNPPTTIAQGMLIFELRRADNGARIKTEEDLADALGLVPRYAMTCAQVARDRVTLDIDAHREVS